MVSWNPPHHSHSRVTNSTGAGFRPRGFNLLASRRGAATHVRDGESVGATQALDRRVLASYKQQVAGSRAIPA